jgi:hypothetical protein
MIVKHLYVVSEEACWCNHIHQINLTCETKVFQTVANTTTTYNNHFQQGHLASLCACAKGTMDVVMVCGTLVVHSTCSRCHGDPCVPGEQTAFSRMICSKLCKPWPTPNVDIQPITGKPQDILVCFPIHVILVLSNMTVVIHPESLHLLHSASMTCSGRELHAW